MSHAALIGERRLQLSVTDLRCLWETSRSMSFTQAAKSLGLTASALSRRVARLEDALGLTIFERGRFGVRLTSAGRKVIEYVGRALDDIEAVENVARATGEGVAGHLGIGVRMPPTGSPLQLALAAWHATCPDVALRLFEASDDDMRSALFERHIDAAFVTKQARWPGTSTIHACRERLVVALPYGHPLSACEMVTWTQLRREPILTQEWVGSHATREFFASLLGTDVRFFGHSASKQSILALVAAGFGITLATASQSEVSFPGVVYRPVGESNAFVDVELSWLPEAENPILGRFVSFIRDRLL